MPALAGVAGSLLTATALTKFVVTTVASIGLNYLANSLGPDPSDEASKPQGMLSAAQASGLVPRSFIVGQWASYGSLTYHNSYGEVNGIPRAFLVQVFAMSDLPIDSFVNCYINDQLVTFDASAAASASGKGYAIPQFTRAGVEHCWIRTHDGTQTTADAFLVAQFGTSPGRPYTSAMQGRGIAYVVLTTRINDKIWTGWPTVKMVMNGVKMYDPRLDTTVGGSGSQRLATPSTWPSYSDNPAVILYNLMAGIKYSGQWTWGMQTVQQGQLPFAAWAAAMNVCDTLVARKGGTERQYRAGGEISVSTEPADEMVEFLKSCNGKVSDEGGRYRINAGPAPAAIFSITDDTIIISEEQEATDFTPLENAVNAVTTTYVAADAGWIEKAGPPRYSATYEAQDGGRRQVVQVNYSRVSNFRQVQRLANAAMLETRRQRKHVFVLPPEVFAYTPLDCFNWTSTRQGYSTKRFHIDRMDDLENGCQRVYCTEVNPNDYDWTPASDEVDESDGLVTAEVAASQPVVGFIVSPLTMQMQGNRKRPAIFIAWTVEDPSDIAKVQWQCRRTSDQILVRRGVAAYEDGGYEIQGGAIVASNAYEVRARYLPTLQHRDTDFTAWTGANTPLTQFVGIEIGDDEIGTSHLKALSVINSKIGNLEVDDAKIVSVSGSKINNLSIDDSKIVSIHGSKIQNLTIDDSKISGINGNKIANLSIDDSKILNVNGNKIVALSITDTQIGNMNGSKIVNLTIDDSKIGSMNGSKIVNLSIQDSKIANIDGTKINALSVDGSRIGSATISGSAKFIDSSINTVKIGSDQVTHFGANYTGGSVGPFASGDHVLQTVTITTETGEDIQLLSSCNTTISGGGGFSIVLQIDGSDAVVNSFFFSPSVAAGSHQYRLVGRVSAGNVSFAQRFLSVFGRKK